MIMWILILLLIGVVGISYFKKQNTIKRSVNNEQNGGGVRVGILKKNYTYGISNKLERNGKLIRKKVKNVRFMSPIKVLYYPKEKK